MHWSQEGPAIDPVIAVMTDYLIAGQVMTACLIGMVGAFALKFFLRVES